MSAFDEQRFHALRQELGASLGAELHYVAETGSTNDDAMHALRAGVAEGALYVAELQHLGRGRRGSRWHAPPGEHLTCSFLLRPPLQPARLSALSLAVGLALHDVCAPLVAARLTVKWPNDLLAGEAKLAGILVESSLSGAQVGGVVIGVGLNVGAALPPLDAARPCTSLQRLGSEVSREQLLATLCLTLGARVRSYCLAGLSALLPELRRHDALLGKRLRVDGRSGVGAGLDAAGALLLRDEQGALQRVTSGHVELG